MLCERVSVIQSVAKDLNAVRSNKGIDSNLLTQCRWDSSCGSSAVQRSSEWQESLKSLCHPERSEGSQRARLKVILLEIPRLIPLASEWQQYCHPEWNCLLRMQLRRRISVLCERTEVFMIIIYNIIINAMSLRFFPRFIGVWMTNMLRFLITFGMTVCIMYSQNSLFKPINQIICYFIKKVPSKLDKSKINHYNISVKNNYYF